MDDLLDLDVAIADMAEVLTEVCKFIQSILAYIFEPVAVMHIPIMHQHH